MKWTDVYQQYFAAACERGGAPRRGAAVSLTAASGEGRICYTVQVSFFPHTEPTDFCISWDLCAEKELYSAPGRRSKKREAALLEALRTHADELAAGLGGTILWEQPLIEARRG